MFRKQTMTQWIREFRASYAFVERNFNLVRRYWGWEMVWLAYSIASTLSITYIGAGMEAIAGVQVDTNHLILYLLIGTMVWRFLAIIFDNISEMIAWERWEGTIEYTLMAPITRLTQMMGQTAFAVLYSFLFTLVILVVVVLFFHLDLSGANLGGAMVMLLGGSLSFIGLGIVASVLPLLFPERGAQMTNVLQAVFLLISGVYYPVDVLPAWLQPLGRVSPATFVLEGMRAAILLGAPTRTLWPYLWPVLLAGIIAIPVGLWTFRLGERYARRTGKLKRDG